jgi:hypothetical protein
VFCWRDHRQDAPPYDHRAGAFLTDGTGIYFTTGNTRIPRCVYPYVCAPPFEPEPTPNHGLSLMRIDKDSANIIWFFQPSRSIATVIPIGRRVRPSCRRAAAR